MNLPVRLHRMPLSLKEVSLWNASRNNSANTAIALTRGAKKKAGVVRVFIITGRTGNFPPVSSHRKPKRLTTDQSHISFACTGNSIVHAGRILPLFRFPAKGCSFSVARGRKYTSAFFRNMMRDFYTSIFSDIRRAVPFIILAFIVFSLGIVIGLAFPGTFSDMLKSFKQMAFAYGQREAAVLVLMIFFRNSLAALISIGLGPFLGVIPCVAALLNGILVGMVISLVEGPEKIRAMLTLIPHGVFELPAIMSAWGLGIWRAAWYFQGRNPEDSPRQRRRSAYRVYYALIVPLLLIAAVIEGICIKMRCFS